MPASPAPRIRTEAPFGSPSSLIGPLYRDSDAKPRLVMASYIAALPATAPISNSRSRRLVAFEGSLCMVRQAQSGRGHGSGRLQTERRGSSLSRNQRKWALAASGVARFQAFNICLQSWDHIHGIDEIQGVETCLGKAFRSPMTLPPT